jgi:hypothetical protein
LAARKLTGLPPESLVRQYDTHRLIPSKYSTTSSVLSDLVDGEDQDLKTLFDLDGVTNDRLLSEHNRLPGINTRELVYGVPYYQVINATFTHAHPSGSRFNGPDRGAWYAGFELRTSLTEVIYHRTLDYREINRFDDSVTYDDYLADFSGEFHDLRNSSKYKDCLSPVSYERSQVLAEELLKRKSLGIVYPSVREKSGICLVCFRPALVGNVRNNTTFRLTWKGAPVPEVCQEKIKRVRRRWPA